jgi:hypothetical protein
MSPSPREGGEKVPSDSEADEGLSRNDLRRCCRSDTKPLIRPSGTFSPPSRGEGKTI